MRWMVGIDIRETSRGAVAFARALRRDGEGHALSALHVIEDRTRAIAAERHPECIEELPARLEGLLAPLNDSHAFDDIGVIPAATAEAGLQEAAIHRPCQGFIIGRRGPSGGRALVRLGRVARRMLRQLDRPTIVVPPDYDRATKLDGPVLLATDLGAASFGAAELARGLAMSLDVDVLATTVVAVPGELGRYLPESIPVSDHASSVRRVQRDLARWIEKHGLSDARSSVVHGNATTKLLEVAEISGASLLVVGSRRIPASDRVFISSLGSHLAAHSPLPVAVVPPRWRYSFD